MKTTIPVMYITQAIGLAVGLSRKELGLEKLFVKMIDDHSCCV
jgi:heterodisulfide reductase subunit B